MKKMKCVYVVLLVLLLVGLQVLWAGGQTEPSAGLHQELRDDRRGGAGDHAGAGHHPAVRSRAAQQRGPQLDRPQLHQHLQAAADLDHRPARIRLVDHGRDPLAGRRVYRFAAGIGAGSGGRRRLRGAGRSPDGLDDVAGDRRAGLDVPGGWPGG